MNDLVPLMIQRSPARHPRVCWLAASEPACGSVNIRQATRHRATGAESALCAGLPKSRSFHAKAFVALIVLHTPASP